MKELKQKQDLVELSDAVSERAAVIRKYIETLDDPTSEMVTMSLDNSKYTFFNFLKINVNNQM